MVETMNIDWTKKPYKLADDLLDAFRLAEKRGYLVGRRRNLIEAWQMWCKLRRHPCVIVKPRRQHASVFMDVVLCDFLLSEEYITPVQKALQQASEDFADITVGLDFCRSNYVFLDKADALAVKLLKVTSQASEENRSPVTPAARNKIGRKSSKATKSARPAAAKKRTAAKPIRKRGKKG